MGTGGCFAAWLRPDQIDLVRGIVAGLDAQIVLAGSPTPGHSTAVADALQCPSSSDLRSVLTSAECDAVFIADPGEFGSDSADSSACAAARSRSVQVYTLEPIPASASELAAGRWSRARQSLVLIDAITFVPLINFGRTLRHASEVLVAFGRPRSMVVDWTGPTRGGGLGARLFAAMSACRLLMGEPETIDACYGWPGKAMGVHALPGESLRDLYGDITAHLRCGDGRGASVFVSDQTALWRRTIRLLGPEGELSLTDDGFSWTSVEGASVDSWAAPGHDGDAATRIIVDAIRTARGQNGPPPGPQDVENVLALAQAALLSARTGQPESPSMIRRIFAGV